MKFESTHGFGDIVYLKTDSDQLERIVTQISFRGSGAVTYSLSCGSTDSEHYDFEISSQKDLFKELNISGKAAQ